MTFMNISFEHGFEEEIYLPLKFYFLDNLHKKLKALMTIFKREFVYPHLISDNRTHALIIPLFFVINKFVSAKLFLQVLSLILLERFLSDLNRRYFLVNFSITFFPP